MERGKDESATCLKIACEKQWEPVETSDTGKGEGVVAGPWWGGQGMGWLDPCWRSEELHRWEEAKNVVLPRAENQANDGEVMEKQSWAS